ncbi:hypothetical protein AB0H34_21780 [Saccharopolyspora shandongensis]|uniref:hypothetical protein n=1 Tax=Saccharopolyspora shandongensis TaxID=418495 RepID=UPI00340CDE36
MLKLRSNKPISPALRSGSRALRWPPASQSATAATRRTRVGKGAKIVAAKLGQRGKRVGLRDRHLVRSASFDAERLHHAACVSLPTILDRAHMMPQHR